MSELGETFAALKDHSQHQRGASYMAGLSQIDLARAEAKSIGVDLITSNDGHHSLK